MLRVRPYRKDDAKTIVTWCKDEETFYKWTAESWENIRLPYKG